MGKKTPNVIVFFMHIYKDGRGGNADFTVQPDTLALVVVHGRTHACELWVVVEVVRTGVVVLRSLSWEVHRTMKRQTMSY